MLFIAETEKKWIKVFDRLYKSTSQNFPPLNISVEYMLACLYKNNVVTWNDKSAGKRGRFSEEYPECGRFYKKI